MKLGKVIIILAIAHCFSTAMDGQGLLTNFNFTDLSLVHVEFPDTVQIGQRATMHGYVKNESSQIFRNSVIINYDIENVEPEYYNEDEEVDEVELYNTIEILPGDSIAIQKSLLINTDRFVPNAQNVVIIWPETHRLIDSDIINNFSVKEVFVREAPFITSEFDDDNFDNDEEDDDDADTAELWDNDDNINQIHGGSSNTDEGDKGNHQNNNRSKHTTELEVALKVVKQNNQQYKIYLSNPNIQIIEFRIYNLNGQLLAFEKTNASTFHYKHKTNPKPLIFNVKYHLNNSKNYENTITKIFY